MLMIFCKLAGLFHNNVSQKGCLSFLFIVFLFIQGISQNINSYQRDSVFIFRNYENSNSIFYSIDSLPESIRNNVDSSLGSEYCFIDKLRFYKGQKISEGSRCSEINYRKYYNKRMNDELNFIYNVPKYELIFKLDIPNIKQCYFFRVFTNKTEKTIGSVPIEKNTKRKCNVVNEKDVLQIAMRKWKIDETNIDHYSFDMNFLFHEKNESFIWKIALFIEEKNKPYFGKNNTLIINAHSGRILKRETEKILFDFLITE